MHLLYLGGTAAALAGLALLYRRWRQGPAAAGPWRLAVAAGWGLVGLGLAGFAAASRPAWGISVAALVLMGAALAVALAPLATTGWAPAPVEREERAPARRPGGYASRQAARLLGALVVAPAVGLAAALAWRGLVPGDPADRLVGAALAAPAAYAAVLIAVVGAPRPWRVLIVVAALAAAAVLSVILGG